MSVPSSSSLTEPALIASVYKAAGDGLRQQILSVLRRNAFGVGELCQLFSIAQPAMSHHLKVLAKAGLVDTRRDGNSIYYQRCLAEPSHIGRVRHMICEQSDSVVLDAHCRQELDNICEQRLQKSLAFFEANASRFRDQQDLIASHQHYGTALGLLMTVEQTAPAKPISQQHWIEVGSGEGELLLDQAGKFGKVSAVDISAELAAKAQASVDSERLAVNFYIDELSELPSLHASADLVTCNMVLHHLASPAQMLEQLATLLAPDGRLLITDLDKHDQNWARESCGDLWLGFAPDELLKWAADAGLEQRSEQFLALRNGFKVQIHEFQLC